MNNSEFLIGSDMKHFKFNKHLVDFGEGVGLIQKINDFIDRVIDCGNTFWSNSVLDFNFE